MWLDWVEMLAEASTQDLQEGRWKAPAIFPPWAAAVQKAGVRLYGSDFRFLAYRLAQLRFAPTESRRRGEAGEVQFAARPYVGDCLIFSGTADPEFTAYRLGKDLTSPFAAVSFSHPGTRWYNLASPIGSRRYFARHAPQILDFFASLVVRRLAEGRRVLLVVKKVFLALCAASLAERFTAMRTDIRVVTGGWSEQELQDDRVVPLISFGTIGTNLFEQFDAVYCLSGFYVNEGIVNQCLQDVVRQDLRLPIRIETVGSPRRRRAVVADPMHRYYDLAHLAQPALEQQEHHVVVQAVGRVRPFTRPREVFTFQMGALPGVVYDAEFRTLAEARRALGILSHREQKRADRATQIEALRGSHRTQAEAARELGISERTVRNYERREDRQ
jgi:DNA-binding CsgD family transcriptional regulator